MALIIDRQRMTEIMAESVPSEMLKRMIWLSDDSRSMGTHIVAGKGSGKSRMMGRIIAWLDFLAGIPQVILDPVGGTIDNFLDKIVRLPREYQERLAPRILYVDMSGHSGRVVPMPLYYRLGDESLSEIAGRFLQTVRRLDPYLVTASVEGWNALLRTGTYTGMVLAALGYQITEAEHLLQQYKTWLPQIRTATGQFPELLPALTFFEQEYDGLHPNVRRRYTSAFQNKALPFTLDPTMQAMFGASKPGLDWKEVERKRLTVLLDFRGEHDEERRRFKMMWAFSNFMEYVRWRGPGRHKPLALVIDELSTLTSIEAMGQSLLAGDLDALINVYARNYMIWPTIAHQEMWQVDERMQKTLMTMGTQIVGSTADMESALGLGQHFFPVNPYRVKRYERVLMTPPMMWPPEIVDHKPVEFSVEEQIYMSGYRIKNQPGFRFMIRPARAEGDVTGNMIPISIENLDPGQFPDDRYVAEARAQLLTRSGRRVEEILPEIEARLQSGPNEIPGAGEMDAFPSSGTVDED